MPASKRMILHVDVNSAFLSWTAVDMLKKGAELDIRTVPSVVGGDEQSRHGIVLAKSTPAKAFGIVTGEPLFAARRKCPNLLVMPSCFPLYIESSNQMYHFLTNFSPVIQRYSIDECFLDYTGMEGILGNAITCAERIRSGIEHDLGFTVNVGVGPNKLLAKMAGELRKPNFVNTIFQHEIQTKLWPLPVRELFMVGHATEAALQKRGIKTIGDLAQMQPELVKYYLKSHGLMVWGYANGIDSSPVVPNDTVAPKSYSNSATLPTDAVTREQACRALLPLCESVAGRMRRDGFVCRLISIQIKYADFKTAGHQQALMQPTAGTTEIFDLCCALFDKLWSGQPIRLLGLRLAELCIPEAQQLSFFNLGKVQSRAELDAATDKIRKKFGRTAIVRAATLQNDFSHLDRYAPDSGKPKISSPL